MFSIAEFQENVFLLTETPKVLCTLTLAWRGVTACLRARAHVRRMVIICMTLQVCYSAENAEANDAVPQVPG